MDEDRVRARAEPFLRTLHNALAYALSAVEPAADAARRRGGAEAAAAAAAEREIRRVLAVLETAPRCPTRTPEAKVWAECADALRSVITTLQTALAPAAPAREEVPHAVEEPLASWT